MHVKYEVSISYGSKVIAKVKVDNRQTDRQTNRQTDKQTNRQDKNNMPPIIRSRGIKNQGVFVPPIIRSGGIKNQGVFVKHYSMPPAATKSKKLFLASRS